jgi:GntR family transcriptional regulator
MMSKAAVVSAGAGVPLHRQLYLVLHDEIARGAIPAGAPLPTEQALCEQFGVSRITVRRALADLADNGLIERKHGIGSFVRECAPERESHGGSYMDGLAQTQFETEAQVLEFEMAQPPPSVERAISFGGDALHVVRVRRERRTGEPLMVTDAWLPAALRPVLSERKLKRTALYELLSDAGVTIDRMQHEITAEIAGPRTAQLLDVPIGTALLRVNRLAFAAGEPHHYLSILLSPSRSRILMTQTGKQLQGGDGLAIAHDVRPS